MQSFHQHDLFDLQTTGTINDFFSLSPNPVLSYFSHANLPAHFPLFTTLRFHSLVSSFIIPHIPLSFCFSPLSSSLSSLHVISFISFLFLPPDLPLHILPPPSLPRPLSFSGRLLIAVSQYHGGRQRGCRSSGECSTRTAGSHSHIQP